MIRVKRNTAAFVLAMLLALPVIFCVTNLVRQQLLHASVNERFKKEPITTIAVSSHEVKWAKKEKEIIINGKYFDVKKYIVSGDSLYLTGFFDHKEDLLVKRISNIFRLTNHNNLPVNKTIAKAIFIPLYSEYKEVLTSPRRINLSPQYQHYAEKAKQVPAIPDNPPPRV